MFNRLGMFDRSLGMFQPPGSIPFNPSQIFAALQGAWLEPVVGSIWQENTGITPTTTGGQTIGKIADQSGGGNNAYQATAANRPVLGRRYNLLTYSEDFSNAVWNYASPSGGATPNTVMSPRGDLTGNTITFTGSGNDYRYVAPLYGVPARSVFTVWLKVASGTKVLGLRCWTTGAKVSANLTTDWQRFSFNVASSDAYIGFDNRSIFGGDGVAGAVYAWGADLRLTADVGKDPTYQRITTATDYDYGQYPAAVHDATDSLSVSLPAINVRRNLLTWSEQFDNGVWTKDGSTVLANTALSFDGTNSADKLTESSGGANHRLTVAYPTTSASYTYSIYAKKAERNWLIIQLADSSGADRRAWFNIDSGVVGTVNTNLTASIQSTGNGWYRCIITIATARNGGNYPYIWLSTGDGVLTYSGDGVSGLYIDKAQLELGSVATPYQKVTDWTSEAYSSSGSTYFATPVGMSALHNQSMGTTFTLPALSTDIYSWIVVPQRLSAAQESRLSRYMERRAGIAGPDYFDQVDYGPELVVNGDFSNGATGWLTGTGWSISNGAATHTGGSAGYLQQFGLITGKTYKITVNITETDGRGLYLVGAYWSPSGLFGTTPGTYTLYATSTQGVLALYANNSWTSMTIDNISVRELKDGMTGQLTNDDGEQLLLAQ